MADLETANENITWGCKKVVGGSKNLGAAGKKWRAKAGLQKEGV